MFWPPNHNKQSCAKQNLTLIVNFLIVRTQTNVYGFVHSKQRDSPRAKIENSSSFSVKKIINIKDFIFWIAYNFPSYWFRFNVNVMNIKMENSGNSLSTSH